MSVVGPEDARLQELRTANTERWNTVKELHRQWNSLSPAGPQPTDSVLTTREAALRAELDAVRRASTRDGIETKDEEQQHEDYSRELIDSFDHLQESNAVLEMELDRKSGRVRDLTNLLREHGQVHEALQSMVVPKETKNGREDSNETELENESKWIRSELAHVAQCWEEQEKRKRQLFQSFDGNDEDDCNSQRDKKRTKPNDDQSQQNYWSLDRLLLELTEKFLTAPMNPSLVTDGLPIDPRHVELLRQCHVLEEPDDGTKAIRLSSYT